MGINNSVMEVEQRYNMKGGAFTVKTFDASSTNKSKPKSDSNSTSKNKPKSDSNSTSKSKPKSKPKAQVPVQKQRFKCDFCTAMFERQKLLNAHWVLHHSKLLCRRSVTCMAMFSNSTNRCIHEKAFHLGGGRWVCDQCSAQFIYMSQLFKHNMKHSSVQVQYMYKVIQT